VIGEGFHELWIGEGDRDLKTKMKDAGGSEGGDTLKRNEASRPWEEEGGILKLKKESMAAMDLWFRTQSPARMARKDAQEKAQALGAGKKKMKVVKSKFPKELIEHMAACPFTVCNDLSDEKLAQRTPYFREVYATVKLFEAKNREYWNALIAQQEELGYAEDENEIEVTDDEEEEMWRTSFDFNLC